MIPGTKRQIDFKARDCAVKFGGLRAYVTDEEIIVTNGSCLLDLCYNKFSKPQVLEFKRDFPELAQKLVNNCKM